MRYIVYVCIIFGYELKMYTYVKDNKVIGKIKDNIELDFNLLCYLKK